MMIALFSDFGTGGPYVGQVKAVLKSLAPGAPVVELMSDAPAFKVRACGYLLAALVPPFPPGSVFLCVVDPGVGTSTREPVLLRVDGRWYVGPGNGLLDVVAKRGESVEVWRVDWQPQTLSRSFHGRDLFAPVAAMLARGQKVPATPLALERGSLDALPDDLAEVIYIDGFGNAMTGLRAAALKEHGVLVVGETRLRHAATCGEAGKGEAFWYYNAIGLVEVAVNQGNAAKKLGLAVGDPVKAA
jgi:S-adenosylmethionine hydrolase